MRAGTGRELVPALFGLGLAALLAVSAAVAWSGAPSDRTAGVTKDPPPAVPLAADKSLGTNVDLSPLDAPERERSLEAMEACGMRWLRQRFAWDLIEVEPGAYEWAPWDEIVDGARRHNLSLIAVLDGSPSWERAEEDKANPMAPPEDYRHFGDLAAAFASRYGDRIDYYQVWDEPNIAPHWGAREINPVAYARLLREGAIRIRGSDPGAKILAAALAPNVETGGANMSEVRFLEGLYERGADEWFDIVAVQPYAFGDPIISQPDLQRLNWRRVELQRAVMEDHGDSKTALWAVSFGLFEDNDSTIETALETTRSGWPWLGPMLWAAWLPSDAHAEYALIGPEGDSRSLLDGLCVEALAPVIAWPGRYPADHPSGRYEGDWRVSPEGADIGGSGDRLLISFRGTRLDLTIRRGDYRAFLFVSVDGEPANALPRDGDGRAYAVLYDPLQEVDTVTLAAGLADDVHTAEIVAERGWGQWAIVGWAVARESTGAAPWLVSGLGLAALVTLAVTVYKAWPHRHPLLAACSRLFSHYRELDSRWTLALAAGATALVYVTIGTVPSLVALCLLGGLLLLRPETGLPLIAICLPFYQLGKPFLGKVFSLTEILTLLTAAGWLGNRLLTRDWGGHGARIRERVAHWVQRLSVLDWGVVALVVWGAVSLLWPNHVREAAREFRTVVLEAGIFYGLLRSLLQTPSRKGVGGERSLAWRVPDAWVLGAGLVALVGVYQWAFGQSVITAEGVWRVRGFYGSPNNLALYLGRAFPLVVAIAVWGSNGARKRRSFAEGVPAKRSIPYRRWSYGAVALLIAAALFFTYSRGAWLLGVPASLLFLAAVRGRRAFLVAVGAMAVVAVVLVLVVGFGRFASVLDTTGGTTFFRLQLWQSSWVMALDHPWLGVGLDNFLDQYRTHYVLPTAWEEFNLSHPHNVVLDFWLRLGLPGMAILLWLLVGFFRRAGRAYRRLSGDVQLLTLGLMAGMVNFVAHGLVDNAFFLVDLSFVFVLMLALVQVPPDGGAPVPPSAVQ